jgi:short-subunit dehydrogenase
LATQGARVVLAARRVEQLEAVTKEISSWGGEAHPFPADVSRRPEIDALIQAAVERYGQIDVLVNNAGMGGGSSLLRCDDAAMQQIVHVNLLAAARCVQAVLPHMRRQGGGMIINMGSVAGEVATESLYSATKFGLRGLNDALRRELKKDNIAVVLITPGFVRTEMTQGLNLPMPGPELVARTVARVIRRPRRKVVVPGFYGPLGLLAGAFPGFTDRVVARYILPQSE